jgi:hypothetical protein
LINELLAEREIFGLNMKSDWILCGPFARLLQEPDELEGFLITMLDNALIPGSIWRICSAEGKPLLNLELQVIETFGELVARTRERVERHLEKLLRQNMIGMSSKAVNIAKGSLEDQIGDSDRLLLRSRSRAFGASLQAMRQYCPRK